MKTKKCDSKVIKIGLDLDGVVTYNPMRLARIGVSYFKHRILKKKGLSFFVPKNWWQRKIYEMGVIWPSFFPARGRKLLIELAQNPNYSFFLVTGRYGFAKHITMEWLTKWGFVKVFKKIYINENDAQPHLFKLKLLDVEKFDYFIEDNLDIVRDLNNRNISTKVYWVYNIFDGTKEYELKYPNLKEALEGILKNESVD